MNLLIVEDEKKLAKILKKGLEEAGFYVDISNDGEEGLYMATEYKYNAIILDINLPKINGLEILENIRKNNIILPVLILTAMGETSDKIKGLNIGADDYMSKPFDFDELLARLYALIRRSKGNPNPIVIIKNLEINLNNKTIRKDNNEIKLSAKEFKLLEYFVLNKDRVIERTEIIEHLYDFDTDSNVIDVYVNYLRNKIDKDIIKTVRGLGYILNE